MPVLPTVITLNYMSWFGKKHDKIQVEFIEQAADKPFAVSTVASSQLPEAFNVATTLDIGGKKWRVVDAIPRLKNDFEKSGTLRVTLAPVHTINPKDILFSLPTINDRMCVLQKTDSLDGMLIIHEDDWRQIEFISEKLLGDVEAEINKIKLICETKRKGPGFSEMHIRKSIETPIDIGSVPYAALKNLFSISKEYHGFGIHNPKAVAERGFAFETKDGLNFYGILDHENCVVFLCLAKSDGWADKCSDLLAAFHLIGVAWYGCQILKL